MDSIKKRVQVYAAGPLTDGMKILDMKIVRKNIDAICADAKLMMDAGISVIIPHLPALVPLLHEGVPYENWMAQDFEHIRRCDILYRRPGMSGGSDREDVWARQRSIPVFYDVQETIAYAGALQKLIDMDPEAWNQFESAHRVMISLPR